ncbi:MAG: GNAT family N-acetyltransferase [Caulobacteraceae bacterium]
MIAGVSVERANANDRLVLENLFQLYVHDFSEQWRGRPEGELGDNGLFDRYPLDGYWSEAGRVPLLARRDGNLCGFALLNTFSRTDAALDHAMAEFFIVRKHRRAGLGAAVAREIFSRFPGRWEVAVARGNLAAVAFWRRVVGSHAGLGDLAEIDLDDDRWTGPVLRFRIGPVS